MKTEISYGKAAVGVYRTYAAPLAGVQRIPESRFEGRTNTLFALQVLVEVFGDNFLPAYTEGDNSEVVATDTMKNFVLQQALRFEGSTMEGFLYMLGEQFLTTYPQMQSLRLSGDERPFVAAEVPGDDSTPFRASTVLYRQGHDDHGTAVLDVERSEGGIAITAHECGRVELQLVKLTGSSFAQFVRDSYTTLPERIDRPLFIYLDVRWKYANPAYMVDADLTYYIPSEQVRDCVEVVFHQFNSKSIQHLVHEMGQRLLDRFPQMAEVAFEAQNRLWDTAFTGEDDPKVKVYTDPRPPYGLIRLRMGREE